MHNFRFFSACIDCVVDWEEWGACADDARSRSQVVVQETVGAGAECPDLQEETEGILLQVSSK